MKAYKINEQDYMGFDGNVKYASNWNKAVQIFNDSVRKAIKDFAGDIVNREDFSVQISSIKGGFNFDKYKIISRHYPYLLYVDDKGNYVAVIYYWQNTSYEYREYEIYCETVVLEPIEIIE